MSEQDQSRAAPPERQAPRGRRRAAPDTSANETSATAAPVETELAVDIYRQMSRIRAAELLLQKYVAEHGFGGFWHAGLGQEAVQAGAVAALRRDDYLFYAHRGLGYAAAKGMSFEVLFSDLLARTTGSTGGKGGGTVHFIDPEIGVLGQGGTLGSNFGLGAGAALSAQLLGQDRVTVVFFGDGAASRGTFHESGLQAAVWKLPVVWVCENNGWAISAPISEQSPTVDIADRAVGLGVPGVVVDGQDALAVYEATATAVARARRGEGPTLIEAKTLRIRGHFEGDQQQYRDDVPDAADIPRDPLKLMRERLPFDVADQVDAEARDEVSAAFETALSAPRAEPDVIFKDVWA